MYSPAITTSYPMRARGKAIRFAKNVALSVCLSVQATKMSTGSDVGHGRSSVCDT